MISEYFISSEFVQAASKPQHAFLVSFWPYFAVSNEPDVSLAAQMFTDVAAGSLVQAWEILLVQQYLLVLLRFHFLLGMVV
ncbi:hypothetical protein VT06_13325 [Arsukibacterium sp. MJ3]|nr:hypothetical protein VT06_13325 [Arsukibacterium sp. MJ3]